VSEARLLQGDALTVLKALPDASVRCCVTSPPYWGLRDYGMPGQLGLERTPEEYVAKMVEVFREVRRVLTDDGTIWLNLGDSYASSPPGNTTKGVSAKSTLHGVNGPSAAYRETLAQSVQQKRNTVVAGLKPKDLVGIPWLVAFALRQPYERVVLKSREDRAWLAAMIDGEGCITTTIAQPTTGINESYAIVLQVRMADRECLDRIVALTGMSHVQAETLSPSMATGNQRPASCWKIAGENAATILAEIYPYLLIKKRQAIVAWNLQRLKDGVTTKRGVAVPAENMALRRELHGVIRALNQREPVDVPEWCREPEYTVEPGWYLRSDVIWAKPNPMPESVTDRPTKSHEYLFLLSKSERYYYDADTIAEDLQDSSRVRLAQNVDDQQGSFRANGNTRPDRPMRAVRRDRVGGASHKERGQHSEGGVVNGDTRNARTVWTIATMPYKGAHFATFPEELARRCILAGSAPGDTVLDPFGGSGTVAQVATGNARNAILIELNPAYLLLARQRIGPLLCEGA
jgi:DNA modification methylase